MKKSVIVGILLVILLISTTIISFILPCLAAVPPGNVAIIVPLAHITSNVGIAVPKVIFVGITTVPLDFAKNQGASNNIVVTFTEAMNPATVNSNTFRVMGPDNAAIGGVITHDITKKIWTFNPVDILQPNSIYAITVTTGAKGTSGNALVEDFVWSFTTS